MFAACSSHTCEGYPVALASKQLHLLNIHCSYVEHTLMLFALTGKVRGFTRTTIRQIVQESCLKLVNWLRLSFDIKSLASYLRRPFENVFEPPGRKTFASAV